MAEATPLFVSGLNASANINGFILAATRWTINRPVKLTEFRNAETNGDTYVAPGFRQVKTFVIYCDYDEANDPLDGTTVEVYEGAILTNVELVKDKTTSPPKGYYIPSAVVTNTPEDINLDGKIIQQIQCAINGPIYQIGAGSGGSGGSGL